MGRLNWDKANAQRKMRDQGFQPHEDLLPRQGTSPAPPARPQKTVKKNNGKNASEGNAGKMPADPKLQMAEKRKRDEEKRRRKKERKAAARKEENEARKKAARKLRQELEALRNDPERKASLEAQGREAEKRMANVVVEKKKAKKRFSAHLKRPA